MRIATWNIGGGLICSENKNVFDLENLDYFVDELGKVDADVICLQEAHIANGGEQPKTVADVLGYKYYKTQIISESHIKKTAELCISVISKFPIISANYHGLSNPNIEFIREGKIKKPGNKGFLEVLLEIADVNVRVVTGHNFPTWVFGEDFLAREVFVLGKEIERIILGSKKPTLVGVDMNYKENVEELIPEVFNSGYKSCLEEKPTDPKGRSLDKILISKEWTLSITGIIPGKADHYLCFADVELEGK